MRLSFRDPDGFVFRADDQILRCVFPGAIEDLKVFLSSDLAAKWMSSGTLVATMPVSDRTAPLPDEAPPGSAIFEHKRIPFPSYPYEWAPEMLHSAAALTLRMAREALDAGFGLKDATPYNIMFDGSKPVFIDVLSFDRRDPLDPVWRPYAQFIRTFIYPLLAVRHFGLRLDELLTVNRDGLEPERMLRLSSPWRLMMPPFLGCVTMPALLSRGGGDTPERFKGRKARDVNEARFLLNGIIRRAGKLLGKATVPALTTERVSYMESGHNYTQEQMAAKERLVTETLQRIHPKNVLDMGCNTGHFSLLAARQGASVVAIEHEPAAAGVLWRKASESGANVLPLVVDIGRPSGAYGWNNGEASSFLERARGRFDCVLMLAIIHHLIVTERVPIDGIFDLVAELTTQWLIVEYVDPEDSQFRRISRGRDALHRDLTHDSFEMALSRRFEIVESVDVTPKRRIYTLRKKPV